MISLAYCTLILVAQGPAAAAQNPLQISEPAVVPPGLSGQEADPAPAPRAGEELPLTAFGPAVIETMAEVLERAPELPSGGTPLVAGRRGSPGSWLVPSRDATYTPHSGLHYAKNKWGDTNMGIGCATATGSPVDLVGFWIAGQGGDGAWARDLFVIGYRNGLEVGRSTPLAELSAEPRWYAAPLEGVDRIEIRASVGPSGGAWYGLDDLTLRRPGAAQDTVVDFEDVQWRFALTGSRYAGLTWERGTGQHLRQEIGVVHAPAQPPSTMNEGETDDVGGGGQETFGGSATQPILGNNFAGPKLGDAGAGYIPPDTCGAVGPDHFLSVVNMNLSIYERSSGTRVINTSLPNFFNTSAGAGDPRAVFDEHSGRFIIIGCDFSSGVFLGISLTNDPTGAWYKTFIALDQGSDAGNWPDYPTLGVDEHGIYTAAYMVGGNHRMSLFAIDKAPLLTATPTLGTVTAWRELPWEGAIHPAVTHGTGSGEYLVSTPSGNDRLRIRRVDGPMTAPTLTEVAMVTIPIWGSAPAAPALGSTSPLSALDGRLMNAEFRDGSLWTTHSVRRATRAAVRWYEVDVASGTTVQVGTVEDDTNYYYMPSIAVNAAGDAALGFTASHANIYAAAWVTGRRAGDALNQMAPPFSMKDGEAAYNYTDGTGTNRWGDYSLTSVDPLDDMGLWTVQEYARSGNLWANWIGELLFPCGDLGTNYCMATTNSSGAAAVIGSSGSISIADNNYNLLAWNLPASQPGIFYYGDTAGQFNLGDGYACAASGLVVRLAPQTTSVWGDASRTFDFTAPPFPSAQITAGSTWYFQFWFRDPAAQGVGYNLTDGLNAVFCP